MTLKKQIPIIFLFRNWGFPYIKSGILPWKDQQGVHHPQRTEDLMGTSSQFPRPVQCGSCLLRAVG